MMIMMTTMIDDYDYDEGPTCPLTGDRQLMLGQPDCEVNYNMTNA